MLEYVQYADLDLELANGPVAHNTKYFNDMQIACDVISGSPPNVWRLLEKALLISLHWFTEPFTLFVHTRLSEPRLSNQERTKLNTQYCSILNTAVNQLFAKNLLSAMTK